jgi:LysM repeat protein
MKKIRQNILFFLLLTSTASRAQNAEVIKNYIDTYKSLAIQEMQRTGVPASITLAQGIHESGAGTGQLAITANNHFGIKCKSTWTGESVKHDDDAKGECFRKYPSAEDSYKDHSDFLKNTQRYTALFTIDPADYAGWANGLKKAGYATNPKYPQVLIKLIEDYQLQDYTMMALGKIPVSSEKMKAIVSQPVVYNNSPLLTDAAKENNKEVKPSAGINTIAVYPEGEFRINETKVVYVKEGTSYLSVAKQYNIDLSKIFEFNEMQQIEEVTKDQLIYLQRKRKTGNNSVHIVQAGETLHDIAQFEAIRLESLQELNWLKKDEMPAVGQQLSLQSKSEMIPKLALKENYFIIPATKNKRTD